MHELKKQNRSDTSVFNKEFSRFLLFYLTPNVADGVFSASATSYASLKELTNDAQNFNILNREPDLNCAKEQGIV